MLYMNDIEIDNIRKKIEGHKEALIITLLRRIADIVDLPRTTPGFFWSTMHSLIDEIQKEKDKLDIYLANHENEKKEKNMTLSNDDEEMLMTMLEQLVGDYQKYQIKPLINTSTEQFKVWLPQIVSSTQCMRLHLGVNSASEILTAASQNLKDQRTSEDELRNC